jgi:hypothetical protein
MASIAGARQARPTAAAVAAEIRAAYATLN